MKHPIACALLSGIHERKALSDTHRGVDTGHLGLCIVSAIPPV